jgi:quercetin dioxygenase-like cupin family protein
MPEDQNILPLALGQTDTLSYYLIQIRNREAPHIHQSHDLVVTLLRGEGKLHQGGKPLAMRAGDVAVVPRGIVHYFVNTGRQPAAAFVTFAPPYDGKDNVPVE